MTQMTLPTILGAALLLAGCGGAFGPLGQPQSSAQQAAQKAAQTGPDTCNAAAYQGMIGQDAASALALPEPKRLVGPMDAVTMDFNAQRLNVGLDDTDTITGFSCG